MSSKSTQKVCVFRMVRKEDGRCQATEDSKASSVSRQGGLDNRGFTLHGVTAGSPERQSTRNTAHLRNTLETRWPVIGLTGWHANWS